MTSAPHPLVGRALSTLPQITLSRSLSLSLGQATRGRPPPSMVYVHWVLLLQPSCHDPRTILLVEPGAAGGEGEGGASEGGGGGDSHGETDMRYLFSLLFLRPCRD